MDDPGTRRIRADKAIDLFRSLGYAAAQLGIPPEHLIQLGAVFSHEVTMTFRRIGQEQSTEDKLRIHSIYSDLWREVGQSFDPSATEFGQWVRSYFDIQVSEEQQSMIRSMGAAAVILVKLAMLPEDVVDFGLLFRGRTRRPLSTFEKRAVICRSIEVAVALLGQSPLVPPLLHSKDKLYPPATLKRCSICARVTCRPGLDGYLESDLAGKPVQTLRAGAKHRQRAETLAALAYATVHAPSIGPKNEYGRWICSDCVLDYWGSIEQCATTTEPANVMWEE
jgi:hypothetical protein